jgi:hypothetical protein
MYGHGVTPHFYSWVTHPYHHHTHICPFPQVDRRPWKLSNLSSGARRENQVSSQSTVAGDIPQGIGLQELWKDTGAGTRKCAIWEVAWGFLCEPPFWSRNLWWHCLISISLGPYSWSLPWKRRVEGIEWKRLERVLLTHIREGRSRVQCCLQHYLAQQSIQEPVFFPLTSAAPPPAPSQAPNLQQWLYHQCHA